MIDGSGLAGVSDGSVGGGDIRRCSRIGELPFTAREDAGRV